MKEWHRLLVVAIGLVLCLQIGCTPPPSRIGLNDKIARANRKLMEAAKRFSKTLDPLKLNKPVDVNQIKTAAQGMQKALDEVKKSFENQKLPAKRSNSAEELVSAYQNFLDAEQKIMDTNVKQIITMVENGAQGQAIQQETRVAAGQEADALAKLKAAQKKYADEHFYSIVTNR